MVGSVLDELKEPLDEYMQHSVQQNQNECLNDIETEITTLEKLESKLIKQKKHDEAQKIKVQLDELQFQAKRLREEEFREELELTSWFRCLTVTELLLANVASSIRLATKTRILSIVMPAIQHQTPGVRLLGLKCLGLLCLTEKEIAVHQLPLLLKGMENDCGEIQTCILKNIFDIVLVYQTDLFESDEHADQLKSLITNLTQFLHDSSQDNRTTAVEGFTKLFIYGIVNDIEVFSTFWCN